MIIIRVLSGKVTSSGELSWGTLLKLRLAMLLASRVHSRGVPYMYVFPQGRDEHSFGQQRPCDLMSQWMLQRDRYCGKAKVPDRGYDLVSRPERVEFVYEAARKAAEKEPTQVMRLRDFWRIWRLEKNFRDLMEMVPELEMDLDPRSTNVRQFPKRK